VTDEEVLEISRYRWHIELLWKFLKGLAIVKQCVDLHGGQVSVKSEVAAGSKPGGTVFTVSLPLQGESHG
jgi:hypothetical protein